MDLSVVPEIGATYAEKLTRVGVTSVESLAVWDDVTGLADAAGIDAERLESFRDAARAQVERALADAGVSGPAALADEDIDALAERTSLDRDALARYQTRAKAALNAKVVLVDGAPVARVVLASATHDAVALLTAGPADEDDEVLARAEGDAVLLKPALDVVPAIIGGVTHRDLPLYKERRQEGGEVEEVRVRIAQIRDVPEAAPEKKRGLGRLFGKK